MTKKKESDKVLGPGAYGDIENPDEAIQSGIISDEVMDVAETDSKEHN